MSPSRPSVQPTGYASALSLATERVVFPWEAEGRTSICSATLQEEVCAQVPAGALDASYLLQRLKTDSCRNVGAVYNKQQHRIQMSDNLSSLSVSQLIKLCKERAIRGYSGRRKSELVSMLSAFFKNETYMPVDYSDSNMLSLYNNPYYHSCVSHAQKWEEENCQYYRGLMCLKPCSSLKKSDTISEAYLRIKPHITETQIDVESNNKTFLCVRPPGHLGKCNHKPSIITETSVSNKLGWVYTTTGNDDYVFKNRAPRLFPIVVPDEYEKKVKSKNVKLKCAIPLKQASTPLMAAAAYIDILTQIMHVEGIEGFLDMDGPDFCEIQAITAIHADTMSKHYSAYNRIVFDNEGYTVCPVTEERLSVENFFKKDIKNNQSIELGHVIPSSDTEFTIRGMNVLLMTREGNRIVGDNVFTDDDWLTKLELITKSKRARCL